MEKGREGNVKVAFFDVDKTLIACNSQTALAFFFVGKHIFPIWGLGYLFFWFMGKVLGFSLMNSVELREKCYGRLKGMKKERVDRLFLEFCEKSLASKISPQANLAIENHRRDGDKIVLVSASIDNIVAWIANVVCADHFFSTELEIRDGCYTGKLRNEAVEGYRKAQLVESWAKDNNINLRMCYAYGNDREDLPLLSSVGYPIVVNPDSDLRRFAIKRDWPIKKW